MEFKLPDIGEGVHEGEIVRWIVKEGDTVAADQPMVEVMTDKATVEIPSPVAGTVEALYAKEGETVLVGKAIIRIGEKGKVAAPAEGAKAPQKTEAKEAAPAPQKAEAKEATPAPQKAEAKAPAAAPAPAAKTAEGSAGTPPAKAPAESQRNAGSAEVSEADREEGDLPFEILATPATRKLARELEVNLRNVPGTGPHGRVTKVDVQRAAESKGGAKSAGAPSHAPATTGSTTAPKKEVVVVARGELKRIPLRGIRRKIAESMAHAKRTAAHFTYVEECDMTAVVKLRASAAEEAKKRGTKLTYLPFLVKALIPVLKEFPYLNSSLDETAQEIILKGDYNIGIATDTPQGLMVPNIKGADQLSIWELADQINAVTERARTGKSPLEELKGGSFTITNAGSIGGVFATPVINVPEVAILGFNAIRKRPVVDEEGNIVVRDMTYFSLSVDHRIVDGADAARFMNRLVYFLSEPTRLVFA